MQTRYQLRHSPATHQDTPSAAPRWNGVSIQGPRACVVLDHHDITATSPASSPEQRNKRRPRLRRPPGEPRPASYADPREQHSQHDPHLATPTGKPRARAVGLKFRGVPGPHNAITDVPGVEVGYTTLIEDDNVRTGVTAIHPRGKHNPGDPVAAGYHSQNGNGEMTGVSWIEESGTCRARSPSPTRTRSASRTPGSSPG